MVAYAFYLSTLEAVDLLELELASFMSTWHMAELSERRDFNWGLPVGPPTTREKYVTESVGCLWILLPELKAPVWLQWEWMHLVLQWLSVPGWGDTRDVEGGGCDWDIKWINEEKKIFLVILKGERACYRWCLPWAVSPGFYKEKASK